MRLAIIVAVLSIAAVTADSKVIEVPKDYATIQAAINAAARNDTVLVAPGTYVENINFIGKAITVKSSGGPSTTIIDGGSPTNPDYGSVVTFNNSEGLDSVIEGFTITNGSGRYEQTPVGWGYSGAGIYCNKASPIVKGNIITKNATPTGSIGAGGGILCSFDSSSEILNNTISFNSVDDTFIDSNGGGVLIVENSTVTLTNNIIKNNVASIGGGVETFDSSAIISDNDISENTASRWGGGISCYNNPYPTITNNRIDKNVALLSGGGIIIYNCDPIISNNLVLDNQTLGSPPQQGYGGGILCQLSSATITSNLFCGNSGMQGGAISVFQNGSPAITNNVIHGNCATTSGAIDCIYSCTPTITNNIITGNRADSRGGGICIRSNSSSLIKNNTIAGNSAISFGGGVCCISSASAVIIDTILWNNSAPLGTEIYLFSNSSTTISYSNLEGGKSSVFIPTGSTLTWNAGMIDSDPLFACGPHSFMYLCQIAAGQPVDSPCVDKGSDLASNLGMDIYWTRTDEAPDTGTVDIGFHNGPFILPSLQSEIFNISAGVGGSINLLLLGDTANANRDYLILGGITPYDPCTGGIVLPGGKATLPLQTWDAFTDLVLTNINTPFFSNFMGKLDSTGSSIAVLDTFGPVNPAAIGLTLNFAYALNKPWDFASNFIGIKIQP